MAKKAFVSDGRNVDILYVENRDRLLKACLAMEIKALHLHSNDIKCGMRRQEITESWKYFDTYNISFCSNERNS